jgi:hypothetical protein
MDTTYRITNQRDLRREFWAQCPTCPENKRRDKNGQIIDTTTRCQFVEFIDALCREGTISEALADRATL